jgi:predicted transcriptional regulator
MMNPRSRWADYQPTAMERQVLSIISPEGTTIKEVAATMELTPVAARWYLTNLELAGLIWSAMRHREKRAILYYPNNGAVSEANGGVER